MNSIAFTYPGFQELPRSIKQLLVTSENAFFNEARTADPTIRPTRRMTGNLVNPLGNTFERALTLKPTSA